MYQAFPILSTLSALDYCCPLRTGQRHIEKEELYLWTMYLSGLEEATIFGWQPLSTLALATTYLDNNLRGYWI